MLCSRSTSGYLGSRKSLGTGDIDVAMFTAVLNGVALLLPFTLLQSSKAPECLVQCAEDIFSCDGLDADCICGLIEAGCSGVIIDCVESLCPSSMDMSSALTWIGSTCGEDHIGKIPRLIGSNSPEELDTSSHDIYRRSIKDQSVNGMCFVCTQVTNRDQYNHWGTLRGRYRRDCWWCSRWCCLDSSCGCYLFNHSSSGHHQGSQWRRKGGRADDRTAHD